jgi:hypothetical protein
LMVAITERSANPRTKAKLGAGLRFFEQNPE